MKTLEKFLAEKGFKLAEFQLNYKTDHVTLTNLQESHLEKLKQILPNSSELRWLKNSSRYELTLSNNYIKNTLKLEIREQEIFEIPESWTQEILPQYTSTFFASNPFTPKPSAPTIDANQVFFTEDELQIDKVAKLREALLSLHTGFEHAQIKAVEPGHIKGFEITTGSTEVINIVQKIQGYTRPVNHDYSTGIDIFSFKISEEEVVSGLEKLGIKLQLQEINPFLPKDEESQSPEDIFFQNLTVPGIERRDISIQQIDQTKKLVINTKNIDVIETLSNFLPQEDEEEIQIIPTDNDGTNFYLSESYCLTVFDLRLSETKNRYNMFERNSNANQGASTHHASNLVETEARMSFK